MCIFEKVNKDKEETPTWCLLSIVCRISAQDGTRYSTVANQFLNWLAENATGMLHFIFESHLE